MIYKRGRNTQHNKLVTKDLTVSRRESQNTLGLFASLCFCSTLSLSVLKLFLCYLLTICLSPCISHSSSQKQMGHSERFMEGDLIKGLMVGLLKGPTQAAGTRASRPFCLNLKGQRVGMRQSKLARTES